MIYINITNTFRSLAKTGIQRVVREFVSRVSQQENINLVAWYKSDFYSLSSAQEIDSLLNAVHFTPQKTIAIETLKKGDVFFDIDASWGDPYDIMQLYSSLKKRGVILVKMHYDAVPVLFPFFSHPNTVFAYTDNFTAALQYCDYWLCISKTVYFDLLKIANNININIGEPFSRVVPLGADFSHAKNQEKTELPFAKYGSYILLVGTVEPRKNHELMLNSFDKLLEDQNINLVIAGKRGWNIDEIAARIETHQYFNTRVFWVQNATDSEISRLYEHSFLTANLSHYEGYGLPVIESLSHGCVTLCTSGGAMEEVALNAAYCVKPDLDSVVDAIKQLKHPHIYSKFKQKAEDFLVPTWEDSAADIIEFLESVQQEEDILYLPKQVVYISIRADSLHRSLSSVIKNMSFITEAVILTSDKDFDSIIEKLKELPLEITVLKESDLEIFDLPHDHQIRNTFLRRKLYQYEKIEPNFIAFDDDSLVISKVNISDFLSNGKHKAYYFYDNGRDWLGAYPAPTSFDLGLWRTAKYLYSCGYDTKLYNSHMPQIINKEICNKILNRTSNLGLDEWSIYFNIAKHLYPQSFEDQIYRAIGWPPNFDSWLPTSKPDNILFENFYDEPVGSLESGATTQDKIQHFSRAYDHSYSLQNSISPALPEIIISQTGAVFVEDKIECKKNTKIFIKVSVDVKKFNLTCEYADQISVFDHHSIPRFLYIQTSKFNKGLVGEIKILLQLFDNKNKIELILPVFLKI